MVKHSESYPIASYGPHEYPYMWHIINGEKRIYNENSLMNYFNVQSRSQRYVWSCFYSFNSNCREFFEEYTSMCKNRYLMDRRNEYFPYADETPFNICLWKRNAIKNYEFGFVNTHIIETVKEVESGISNKHFNNAVDAFGRNWEYVDDSSKVMFYHGFKEKESMEETVKYLVGL